MRWWLQVKINTTTAYNHRLKKYTWVIFNFYFLHILSVLHCDNKESVWYPYPQSDGMNTFNEAAGHKANVQNSVVYLLIIEKHAKEKIGGKIIFNIIKWTNKTKILNIVINLTKDVKDLYNENLKALKKKTREDTRRWKTSPYSWIERINTVKKAILTKEINNLNIISIKIPMRSFTKQTSKQKHLKFTWEHKRPKQSWGKRATIGSWFLYYTVRKTKIARYWYVHTTTKQPCTPML